MPISFGLDPDDFTVYLAYGANFIQDMVNDAGPWADGTAFAVHFCLSSKTDVPAYTWAATVSGDRASWNQPASDVQAVLDANASYARLIYTDPDGDTQIWAVGRTSAR